MGPNTNNYVKGRRTGETRVSPRGPQGDRFEFFDDQAPAHVDRARKAVNGMEREGYAVSVYRRCEGLEDLVEVGQFDPGDLLDAN